MRHKQYLIAGFVFHTLASIWFILSHVSTIFGGDFEAWVYSNSSNLLNYGMILAAASLVLYVLDIFTALYRDFGLFSIIKIPVVGVSAFALFLLYLQPDDTTAKLAWHATSALLTLVQFHAFRRDYTVFK